jgi:uncharacterized YigZ family protein
MGDLSLCFKGILKKRLGYDGRIEIINKSERILSAAYAVPAQAIEVEYEVKKSRFIARAACVNEREAAMAMLAQAKVDYPDARHHCWAYQLGSPQSPYSAAMSDDGEPSGTAGKPILNVLQHKDVGDIMIVVIRYFGGIKLGAGGLVRAYSAAAQMAMEQLPLLERVSLCEFEIELDFAQEQAVRHWLSVHKGKVDAIAYQQQVNMSISLPEVAETDFVIYAAALGLMIKKPESL